MDYGLPLMWLTEQYCAESYQVFDELTYERLDHRLCHHNLGVFP